MPDVTAPRRGTRLGAQRLSPDDWLSAGMRLLVDEGIDAVKISRLSSMLGVTKGSFYWHFADIAALKTALAQRCADSYSSILTHLDDLSARPPRERLIAMSKMIVEPRRRQAQAALGRWAEVDEIMAESVKHLEERVHAVVTDAMRELGFTDDQVHARASALHYAGIGYVHARRAPDHFAEFTDEHVGIVIDLLTRP
uniref:TetR/AcrR family transcriptional regulator n=1 Tax=Gordonia sp. B7-2 TaxID=3420932 RepID=UPI003D8EB764